MNHEQSHSLVPDKAQLRRALTRGVVIVVVLFVAAQLLARITYAVIRPHLRAVQMRSENNLLEKMVVAKRQEKKDLQQQIDWWKSPPGEEELAHSKGLVKPGEHTLVLLPPLPAKSAAISPVSTLPVTHHHRLIAAVVGFVCAFIFGIGLLVRRRRMLARRPAGTLTPRSELRRHQHSTPTPTV